MPRTRPPTTTHEPTRAHALRWPEVTLLIAYLVICLLSVLTVLLPTTENEEEHGKPKLSPSSVNATPAK